MLGAYNLLPLKKNIKRNEEGGIRTKGIKKNSNKKFPFISIITVVKNGEKYLEETIKSVLNQNYKNFEYILIDGASDDKTLQIIKKFSNKIDYWVSEEDLGLYDAHNKALSLCQGDYIGIINSDDIYLPDALEILVKYINENNYIDFIFGSVKREWGIVRGYIPNKIYYSWGFYSSHSTGFFIKKTSALKVGLYNLKYKYHSDYDYFFRMIVKENMKGISTKKNEIFGVLRRGGFSATAKPRQLFQEEMMIRFSNGQNFLLLTIIFIFRLIKNLRRILINK